MVGPNQVGMYQIIAHTLDQAEDILGLNPNKKSPEGMSMENLSDDVCKNAQNTICQWKSQRKRNCKLKWYLNT